MRETRCQISRRRLVAGLGATVGGTILMNTSSPAMAEQQRVRPLISLSCPADGSEIEQALCDALRQALKQAVPHAMLRYGEEIAPMPGSMALKLVPVRETRHSIAAHLEWKTTAGAAWQTGPEVALDSPDVALRVGMMTRLAPDMIRVSKVPLPGTDVNTGAGASD